MGWGLIGEPRDGVIVDTGNGRGIDVHGYQEADYWAGDQFLGPDQFGIVPIYRAADGSQFPPDAKEYPANS